MNPKGNPKGSPKKISNLRGIREKIVIWRDQINRNKVIVSELDILLRMNKLTIIVLNIRRIKGINQSIHNRIETKVQVKVILEEKCLVENL